MACCRNIALMSKHRLYYFSVLLQDDYDEDGANVRSRGAVLPSVQDPSLFQIKLQKGARQEEAVQKLMFQYYLREQGSNEARKLQILSCFCTPAARDSIYVEAWRETHVEMALQSVPSYRAIYRYYRSSTSNIKVPIQEMVATLKFNSEEKLVAPRQWVRMKRGPYKDDLAQVVRLQDQGALITIKLIPRIDYAFLEAKRDNEKLSRAEFARTRPDAARRPPQKLFDPTEVRGLGQLERKRGLGGDKDVTFHTFNGARYKNGFTFKEVKIDALELDSVLPTADELDKFASKTTTSDDDEDDEEEEKQHEDSVAAAHAAAMAGPRRAAVYSLNDRVIITAGGMVNVTGRVRRIDKDRLHIQADDPLIRHEIQEVFSHVRKYFTVSAHVKVVAGVYKDESGMITHVFPLEGDDQQLAIHTDISVRDIIVSSTDVIESSEISTGRDSFGSYELGDLVQLTGDMVAMIIKINMASFSVLTSGGIVQQLRLQEIRFKRSDRFAKTNDKFAHTVELGDVVHVLSGPQRGRQATVKHIFKKTLFLHNRELMDNGGVFTIRGDQVALVGQTPAAGARASQAPKSPSWGSRSPGPAPRSPGPAGGVGYGGAAGGAPIAARPGDRRMRDPLIGRDVKITGGQYKGYAGVCIDVTDNQARVEIRAVFRKVQVARNQLTVIENIAARAASGPGAMYGGATPLVGGATPAHTGYGSATPGFEMGGSMTPYGAGGSRTPSHRTPSHSESGGDVWAPQTPAHRQADRVPEEEEEEDWRTQMQDADMRTPGANPLTPGGGAAPQTPRTPYAPQTPLPPTTPHDVDAVPQTPATPYDPSAAAAAAEEEEEEEEAAEAEPAAEPEPAAPEGQFTRQEFVGCHVLVEGGDVVHVITSIDSDYNVHVRPLAGGGDTRIVAQSDLAPVHPTKEASWAVFMVDTQLKKSSFRAGDRIKIISSFGEQVLVEREDGENAVLTVDLLPQLCKCEATADSAAANDDEVAASAATKRGKKKGKVKSERR